jgi:hypothetical protein
MATKRATQTIPIVMMTVGDPVSLGLVASIARPGGNVTGVTSLVPDTEAKRLGLLKEAVPHLAKVAVLRSPAQPLHSLDLPWAVECSSAETLRVSVREKHNIRCGGDPNFAPSRFFLELDRRTGAARWTGGPNSDWAPIPAAPSRSLGSEASGQEGAGLTG